MNGNAKSGRHNVIFDGADIGVFDSEITLLENFKKKELEIPHLCCSGSCGCCKMLLRSGTVSHANHSALTEEEIQENVILACCACSQSDLEIEIY